MLEKFFTALYGWRASLISGLIIFLIIFYSFFLDAHVVDFEPRTLEWDRVEQEARDKENRESFDRFMDGTGNERDERRANEYVRDTYC